MAEIIGAAVSDLAAPRSVWRSSWRRVFSFALYRPAWEAEVNRFVEALPGSGVAFVVGAPSVEEAQRVAVIDVMVPTTPAGLGKLTVGELARTLGEYFPGAELLRLERTGGETLEQVVRHRESALGGAVERDRELDAEQSLLAKLRAAVERTLQAGAVVVVLLLVAVVALLAYAPTIRKRLGAAR